MTTKDKVDDGIPSAALRRKSRRTLLRGVLAGSAVAGVKFAPETWTRPVVDSVILPSHAQTSPQDDDDPPPPPEPTLSCGMDIRLRDGEENPTGDVISLSGGNNEAIALACGDGYHVEMDSFSATISPAVEGKVVSFVISGATIQGDFNPNDPPNGFMENGPTLTDASGVASWGGEPNLVNLGDPMIITVSCDDDPEVDDCVITVDTGCDV